MSRKFWLPLLGFALAACLGVFVGYGLLKRELALAPPASAAEPAPSLARPGPASFASATPTEFTTAAAAVTPAVVFIRTTFRDGTLDRPNLESVSSGSGVLFRPDGLIATNNHVVEGASRIRVTLSDRREYDAVLIGADASTDLALLRIPARGLPFLPFGNSDSLRVGEWVLAVGNPFELTSTVTAGIVSAKGRSIDVLRPDDRIESFIQTDAAVNPGNSGGALVNTNGELVGINTAILTKTGRHEGFAFAIPGNLAQRVLDDLNRFGEVRRARLGARVQGVNDAQARQLGLRAARGVLITDLSRGGSALRAGLEVGDVIVAINNQAVNGSPQLQEQLSRYRPGQRVRLTYIRNRRRRHVTVLLRDTDNAVRALVSERADDLLHRLGFEVRPDTADGGGIRVISVFRDSPVAATNMNAGFLITQVNGRRISELDDFLEALRSENALLFAGTYAGYAGEYYYQLE